MITELPLQAKKQVLETQLGECLTIKFRKQLEIKHAEYFIRTRGKTDETTVTVKSQEINEAKFVIKQMDDKIAVLNDEITLVNEELPTE